MELKGLDYNTQRQHLLMPEYGRTVQDMVSACAAIPTRRERQKAAEALIKLMESRAPHIRRASNYKQILWDHLFLLSEGKLDIDWPENIQQAEGLATRPAPMPLPENKVRLRHYGRLVEEMLKHLSEMPESEERDQLTLLAANQMKRDLILWGHGSIDDERIAADLSHLTGGRIHLDSKILRFMGQPLLPEEKPQGKSKRKKKK